MKDKEKQRELIVEIMKADEQSGIYPAMKQTAVDWLINEIDMQYPEINVRRKQWMVDKAKQMEKEQMLEVSKEGIFSTHEFEQYYKETYE